MCDALGDPAINTQSSIGHESLPAASSSVLHPEPHKHTVRTLQQPCYCSSTVILLQHCSTPPIPKDLYYDWWNKAQASSHHNSDHRLLIWAGSKQLPQHKWCCSSRGALGLQEVTPRQLGWHAPSFYKIPFQKPREPKMKCTVYLLLTRLKVRSRLGVKCQHRHETHSQFQHLHGDV